MNTPRRLYYFSDTYGGHEEPNPLKDPDADALISTDFGSAMEFPVRREFDIFGKEAVTDHILRLIIQQHDEFSRRIDLSEKKRNHFLKAGTGIFINHAPRTDKNNGEPFYLATARSGDIRVVATPLSALSVIRKDVETLSSLPNPQYPQHRNGLYDSTEQFRSRLTPVLLNEQSELPRHLHHPSIIPEYSKGWHVSYIDRFGNVLTWAKEIDEQWAEIERVAGDARGLIGLSLIRDNVHSTTGRQINLAESLAAAQPGTLSIYKNRNIDIVWKWHPDIRATRNKLFLCAAGQLGAEIGDGLEAYQGMR